MTVLIFPRSNDRAILEELPRYSGVRIRWRAGIPPAALAWIAAAFGAGVCVGMAWAGFCLGVWL